MINKLSFLPTESLYSLRCQNLALDDFEDIEIPPQFNPIITDDRTMEFRVKINRMLNSSFNGKETKDLLNELKNNHCENLLNFSYFNGLPKDKRLDYDIVFYIINIILAGDKVGLSELSNEVPYEDCFDKISYKCLMLSLAREILFGIADEDEMLESRIAEDYPSIGYFGYYNSEQPHIVLCSKRIDEAVETLQNQEHVLRGFPTKEDARKALYAIVIIHLLAQAMLDSTNRLSLEKGDRIPTVQLCKKEEGKKMLYEKIEPESYLLMEKSLANMLTLNYFNEYSKRFEKCDYKEVREFIFHQPDAYKFGLIQYDYLKPDWRLWRDAKSNLKIFCKK